MTTISITGFGAVGDGITDNRAAIQAAFNYAAATGDTVYIPGGNFAYSGTLTANGITVSGAGSNSVLKALNGASESLILTGSGGTVSNLQMDGSTAPGRLATFQSGEIWVKGATNYTIQNVLINGSASVGIVSDNSSNGTILGNTIENTLADAIHTVNGSNHVTISQNRILNSGDDGISVVTYSSQPLVHDIAITGNTVLGNLGGRGLSVVGGANVTISGNHVESGTSPGADIYLAAEIEWNTAGIGNVTVSGNTLINTGNAPASYAPIIVYNSEPSTATITGLTVSGNQLVNPAVVAVALVGAGPEQISLQNNTVYTAAAPLLGQIDPAAAITSSGNQLLAPAAYTTPLVPAGGGIGSTPAGPTVDPASLLSVHSLGTNERLAFIAWENQHYGSISSTVTLTPSVMSTVTAITLQVSNGTLTLAASDNTATLPASTPPHVLSGNELNSLNAWLGLNPGNLYATTTLTPTLLAGIGQAGISLTTLTGLTTATGGGTTGSTGSGTGSTTGTGTTTSHPLSVNERLALVAWENQYMGSIASTATVTSTALSTVTGLTVQIANGSMTLQATDSGPLPAAGPVHTLSSSEQINFSLWQGQNSQNFSATTTLTPALLSTITQATLTFTTPPAATATTTPLAGATLAAATTLASPVASH